MLVLLCFIAFMLNVKNTLMHLLQQRLASAKRERGDASKIRNTTLCLAHYVSVTVTRQHNVFGSGIYHLEMDVECRTGCQSRKVAP